MTKEELLAYLTEGTDEATKTKITEVFNDVKVAARSISLRQQGELDRIESERRQLQDALDGLDPQGNPKGYRAWYNKNFPEIQAMQAREAKYVEKYGTLESPKTPDGTPPPAPTGKQWTDEDVQRAIDERFQKSLAPNIASVLKGTGRLVQRHMFAGRKTEIDFDKLESLMNEAQKSGRGMSLDQAYEEWDKPEREKDLKAAEDKRVEARVTEELQKRGSTTGFPAGSDMSSGPGVLAARDSKDFNLDALKQDLLGTYLSGKAPN